MTKESQKPDSKKTATSLPDAFVRYQATRYVLQATDIATEMILGPVINILGAREKVDSVKVDSRRELDKWLLEETARFPEELKKLKI